MTGVVIERCRVCGVAVWWCGEIYVGLGSDEWTGVGQLVGWLGAVGSEVW